MKKLFVLFYHTVDNFSEAREAYRKEHLSLIKNAHENKHLIMAGALIDPLDSALLVFGEEHHAISFAEKDPYVIHGLIKKWEVRPWMVVMGID